jgi:hypothetical protein
MDASWVYLFVDVRFDAREYTRGRWAGKWGGIVLLLLDTKINCSFSPLIPDPSLLGEKGVLAKISRDEMSCL